MPNNDFKFIETINEFADNNGKIMPDGTVLSLIQTFNSKFDSDADKAIVEKSFVKYFDNTHSIDRANIEFEVTQEFVHANLAKFKIIA
jgi:hypothetical protein